MAPEQLEALPVSARTDVFAFGVTAWELLCGRRPFQGATLAVLLEQIEAGPREPLVAPGVAREALAMITACLRAEPRDRPASMLVVKAALEDGRGRRVGRGLVIAAGLGGTAAVAMAAVLLVGGGTGAPAVAPPACDATRAPWWESAGWPARAAASGALSTARIDAVRKVMDQRAAAWRTHAAATCAGGLMAQQAWTWCRERVEGAERALLDAAIASPWPDGDAAVSVRLTGLDLPADCGTREAGEYAIAVGALPAPQRQRVPEVLADLERAGVAMARGDAAGAQALVARWQADPELAGAAFLQEELALVGAMLGADPTATVDKARALAAISERAARSGSSSLVARASLLVVDAALGRSDSELVRRHLAQADWAIARIGEPPRLRTRWHLSVGNVALNEGRWPDAVAAYRAAAEAASQDPLLTGWRTAALARVSSALGSDADAVQAYRAFLGSGGLADLEPLERVTLLLELAEALYRLGRLDDALAELTRADAAMPAGATGVVPRLRVEVVRASIETDQEHFEAARDRLDGVRATIQREVPDEVALLADVELRLAYTLLLLQEIDRCVAMARSAAATFATLDGEATAGGASAESLIGEALALQGKRAEAAVALASAVRQAERVYGAEHPMVAQLRPPLARALATLDRRAEAITQLELALAAFAKTEFAPEAIAEAEFELARLVLKMDRPRALALAAAAEARLVGPANARQRAEVAAWRKRPR
jgi:tetratricopeptide (TPR) repeat protein